MVRWICQRASDGWMISRAKLAIMAANLPPCVIGMEACSTSHHWARRSCALGHEVRLIQPNFVRPYVSPRRFDQIRPGSVPLTLDRKGWIAVEEAAFLMAM
jgi:hypothetical protein